MTTLLTQFIRNEQGQDLIEYALLIGIVTLAAITAVFQIGPKVQAYFDALNANMP